MLTNGKPKRTEIRFDFLENKTAPGSRRFQVFANQTFADGSTKRIEIGTKRLATKTVATAFVASLNWAYNAGKEDASLPEDFFQADADTISRIRRAFAQTEGIA